MSVSVSPCLRGELEVMGFVVSRRPFRHESEHPIHHMRSAAPVSVSDAGKPAYTHYSIDLASGRWNRWGVDRDGVWHELRELLPSCSSCLGGEQNHEDTKGTKADDVGPFVMLCLQSGCTLDDELERRVDFGNRFVRFADQLYLACEQTQELIDRRFERHKLFDFAGESPAIEQAAAPESPCTEQPPFDADPPRPANRTASKPFILMREQPVTFSGARRQPSLF